jgi:hypothetical protein
MVMAVSSLLNLSLTVLVRNVSLLETELETLPFEVKSKCLKLLSRRGLVNNSNIHRLIDRKTTILDFSECEGISDVGLTTTATCCNVVKVDLNSPGANDRVTISSDCLASLAPFWPRLQVLLLRRCTFVTDQTITAFAENCRMLKQLNLSGCGSVTDVSLKMLAKYSVHLESIDMSRTKITDCGVRYLAMGACRESLHEVHMGHCVKLTDVSVVVLLKYCKVLATLVFHGCPLITDQSRVALESLMGPSRPMKQLTWTVY